MKKITKITALAVAVIMLCLSLTGCASLDLKREEHAVWTNDKSIDSITLSDGETYLKLDKEYADKVYIDYFNWLPVYVTEKDVPVLLSGRLGEALRLTEDKSFIYGFIADTQNYFESNNKAITVASVFGTGLYFSPVEEGAFTDSNIYSEDVVYCKEDVYDDVMKRLEKGVEYTHYGYDYYLFNEETFEDKHDHYYLSKDESEVIEKIFKEVKPKTNNDIGYNASHVCTLNHFSDDHFFGEYTCDIYMIDNTDTYYLACYIDSLDTFNCYKVPDKYIDDIESITEIARESLAMDYEEIIY